MNATRPPVEHVTDGVSLVLNIVFGLGVVDLIHVDALVAVRHAPATGAAEGGVGIRMAREILVAKPAAGWDIFGRDRSKRDLRRQEGLADLRQARA